MTIPLYTTYGAGVHSHICQLINARNVEITYAPVSANMLEALGEPLPDELRILRALFWLHMHERIADPVPNQLVM